MTLRFQVTGQTALISPELTRSNKLFDILKNLTAVTT